MTDPFLDATGQAALVRAGEVSAAELVDEAIARIEAVDAALNAVIVPLFDDARKEAASAGGPFAGVPWVLMDLGSVSKGHPRVRFLTSDPAGVAEVDPEAAAAVEATARALEAAGHVVAIEAWEHVASTEVSAQVAAFTMPATITGRPAISVPTHQSASGLPLGVQPVGANGREDLLLRLAAHLEEALPWHDRRPRVSA